MTAGKSGCVSEVVMAVLTMADEIGNGKVNGVGIKRKKKKKVDGLKGWLINEMGFKEKNKEKEEEGGRAALSSKPPSDCSFVGGQQNNGEEEVCLSMH